MSDTETQVDLEEWSEIDVSGSNKETSTVEYEIEDSEPAEQSEELKQEANTVDKDKVQDVTAEAQEEEKPEELDGIKTKGAEKRIKQLIRQRKEREEEIEKLRSEVENLRGSVKTKEKELSSSLKTSIDSTQGQISSRIEQAREIFKQAADSGDTDRMLAAQEEMSKAYAESMIVKQQQQAWEEYNARIEAAGQTPEQHMPEQQQNQYDPKAVAWASKNPWFGQDQIRTAAALAADAELKSEGYDPSDDDFYEEIDNKLRKQFPNLYEEPVADASQQVATPRLQDTPSNSAQVVAGASRTPQASRSNKVKLSQEDVRRANKWGIPLEQYAAEKLKAEQADGEYTEIS